MNRHQCIHAGIQIARRSVQVFTLFLLAGLAILSLYAHYRAARALDDEQLMSGWKGAVLRKTDNWISYMDEPQEFLDGWKGTLWSMKVAGVDWSDPLAGLEMTAASRTIYAPMLLTVIIPVIMTLLLGKVFCSWICPANLLFEITGKLRRILRYAEIEPAELNFSRKNKYIFLAAGLVTVAAAAQPIFALVYPPAVVSRLIHAWIFGTAAAGMILLLGTIVVFEILVAPRAWCRSLCPGGALYGLLGWWRVWRVRLNPSLCTLCGKCESVCQPGLNPVFESSGIECDNCGACVRHCPEKALFNTIGLPTFSSRRGDTKIQSSQNRFWPPAAACILAFLVFFSDPPNAHGHHILGLPHYSYKENYPQVPTLEYPAIAGPYDVLLTSYPGKPVPRESTSLAIYIKNRLTGTPYDQPITVRVLQTFTFGRNRIVLEPIICQPFEQPRKIAVTFPEDGEYIVELSMEVDGKPEVIPFMIVAGEPTAAGSILIVITLGLGLFIIVVRAIKIKRERRLAAGKTGTTEVYEPLT